MSDSKTRHEFDDGFGNGIELSVSIQLLKALVKVAHHIELCVFLRLLLEFQLTQFPNFH